MEFLVRAWDPDIEAFHIKSQVVPINYLDLCKNTTEYTYNHKYKDAMEITLHFINIKELKFAYRQNGNKLARVLVAYL